MSGNTFGFTVIPTDGPAAFTAMVDEVEASGIDYLWLCDSTLHSHDPYSYLTMAALRTKRTKLGINCSNPMTRHPAATLNALSTVDEISGGRVSLSFGTGAEPLFELGLKRGKVEAVRQAVQLSKRLLTEDKVDYEGQNQLKGAKLQYRNRKDLPIYVTASGPKMLEMAGEVADGVIFLSGGYVPCVKYALGHIEAGAKRAGRNLKDIDVVYCGCGVIGEDHAKAMEESRTLAAWVVKVAPVYAEIAGVPRETIDAIHAAYSAGHFHEAQAAAKLLPIEFVERLTLAGTPDDFRRQLAAILELGVRHIEYETMSADRAAAARLFGRQVVQKLR